MNIKIFLLLNKKEEDKSHIYYKATKRPHPLLLLLYEYKYSSVSHKCSSNGSYMDIIEVVGICGLCVFIEYR
jgi:hypothetical protein